ncbi:MAG TPA: O-antigen ligase family protein [Clostridia bacterium]
MNKYDLSQTRFSIIIRKLVSSIYFPFFIALITYISWAFSLVFLGLWIFTILIILLMVTQKNSIYALPIFLIIFYMFPDFKEAYYFAGINLGLCVLAAIYHIFAYKVKLDKGELFYPIMATFLAGAVGGIVYTTMTYGLWHYIKDTLFILMLAVSFGGGYLFLNSTITLEEDFDYKKYISYAFLCLAFLLIAQMATYYARVEDPFKAIANKTLRVGWGNTNTIATVLMAAVPFILYLSTQYKYGMFFLPAAFLAYGAIWVTQSRGCILASTPLLFFYVIYLIIKTKDKKRYWLIACAGLCVIAAAALLVIFKDRLFELFKNMFAKGLDDSGRFELYKEAWELFKKHFLFGTGYFYKTDQIESFMYMFHSTPLQIMANLGVAGVIAFGYFYYYKYKILLKNRNHSFGMAIIISIVSLELYGLIDVYLVVYFLAITTIALLIIAQKELLIKKTKPEGEGNG